jgi:fucose 4-O-acetylase-like acetyltransferase
MQNRQMNPDWLKGVAITLMVYGHISHVGSFSDFQNEIVGWIYTFHMPLFLIISGFFININLGVSTAGKKVVRRLVVPYVVFISLYLFGLIIIQYAGVATANLPPTSALDFIRIVLINPRGGYWFLHTIIVLQLIILISREITERSSLDKAMFLCIAFLAISVACMCNLLTPRTATFFLIGIGLKNLDNNLPSSTIAGATISAAVVVTAGGNVSIFGMYQITWCLGILALLAGIGSSIRNTNLFKCFAWIGRNSLIILVLHAVFITLTKVASPALMWVDGTGIVFTFVSLIITLFGSLLSARLIDKLSMSGYVFGATEIYSPFNQPFLFR